MNNLKTTLEKECLKYNISQVGSIQQLKLRLKKAKKPKWIQKRKQTNKTTHVIDKIITGRKLPRWISKKEIIQNKDRGMESIDTGKPIVNESEKSKKTRI